MSDLNPNIFSSYPELELTIRGADRSGKSTISKIVAKALADVGINTSLTDNESVLSSGSIEFESMLKEIVSKSIIPSIQSVHVITEPESTSLLTLDDIHGLKPNVFSNDTCTIKEYDDNLLVNLSQPRLEFTMPEQFCSMVPDYAGAMIYLNKTRIDNEMLNDDTPTYLYKDGMLLSFVEFDSLLIHKAATK